MAFDRETTPEEVAILQQLIDVSYGQFVATVAKGRGLEEETVRTFADGRVFTGEQALELGLVDRLGTEEDARRWAAELAGLDPDKTECFNIEEDKPFINRFIPGRSQTKSSIGMAIDSLQFELATNGLPLWLYRP